MPDVAINVITEEMRQKGAKQTQTEKQLRKRQSEKARPYKAQARHGRRSCCYNARIQ